ncbi:MAG TPA: ABC transporter substrate-binding protein [Terriglobales bacterium]|nr:ABC transporter substrate-binding protein [Terriglobales bacterium]
MFDSLFPHRVVSLQPSATVTINCLGLLDRLVACTRYCADVCPEVNDGHRILVHDSWTAQSAQILAAHPDLVIASVPYQEKAVAEILRSGISFLGLAPHTLADIYGDVAKIAGVLGEPGRAESVIHEMQQQIAAVESKTRAVRRPLVFCEEWGRPIIHSQPWVAELVHAAGGEFLGQAGKQTPAEDVGAADPEVIVAAWCGAGDRVPLEKIIHQRGWSHTRAARDGRVYCLRDEWLNTPAPTLLHGLGALAHAIHPELFPSVPGIRRINLQDSPS